MTNKFYFVQRRVRNVFLSGSRNDGSRYDMTSRRLQTFVHVYRNVYRMYIAYENG